jgi:hypothetical protein
MKAAGGITGLVLNVGVISTTWRVLFPFIEWPTKLIAALEPPQNNKVS